MKTKKFLFAMAALLCVMAVSVTVTSCSKDDDDDQWWSYSVQPYGTIDVLNCNALQIAKEMTNALDNGMDYTYGVCKRNDSKAKSICDKAYQEYKDAAIGGPFVLKLYVGHTSTSGADNSVEVASYQF